MTQADATAATDATTVEYTDQTLSCRDCRADFTWTTSEQRHYAERNFLPPRRCPDCRRAARERKRRDEHEAHNSGGMAVTGESTIKD